MGRWLNGELLASGELAEPLAGLDGLPLRLPTLRAHLASSDSIHPTDPGWTLLHSAGRWAAEPFALADRPWWEPSPSPREADARDSLWRHSVAHALAARSATSASPLDAPTRSRLVDAALLHRLDLWALAVLSPARLADWLEAAEPNDRARLELRWFGAPGPSVALKLARGWRADPLLIDLLGPPPANPSTGIWAAWRATSRLFSASRWNLTADSPAPGDEPSRLALDAAVQAACSRGLTGPSVDPDLAESIRSHARTRVELNLARASLRVVALQQPEPAPPLPRPDRVGLDQLAEFAAGAAHEINNPLAVVVGRAQLLLAKTAEPETKRSLQAILTQARRAHQMLRDLIYIARPPALRPKLCSPDGILRAVVSEHQAEAAERGLELALRIETPGENRSGDAEALRHLADILVRNALEASPQGGRVLLRSRAGNTGLSWRVDTPDARLTDEQAEHLFDPFFCGRQAGRGLGLGLPRAARWVEASGGSLRLQRDPEGGTSFTVFLPDADADAEPPARPGRTGGPHFS